jgi:hypothetical protein
MRFSCTIIGVALAATVGLTACGSHASTPAASGVSPGPTPVAGCCAPMTPRVTGHLVTEGGPAGTPSMHWPGTITVRGPVDRTVRTDVHGGFRLDLPAGSYRVTGHSPRYQSGRATCSASGPLVVRPGAAASVDVVCQLK